MSWLNSIFGVPQGKDPVKVNAALQPKGSPSFSEVLASKMSNTTAFDKAVNPLLKSNKTHLAGKDPMKFGIMQSTLKDYDPKGRIARNVSDLTEDKAKSVYRKIWERSGSNNLPEQLGIVHFNTYVQRPKTAIETLKKSGGNVENYMALKKASFAGLKTHNSHHITALNKHIEQQPAVTVKSEEPVEVKPPEAKITDGPVTNAAMPPIGWSETVLDAIDEQTHDFKTSATPEAQEPVINNAAAKAEEYKNIFKQPYDSGIINFNKTRSGPKAPGVLKIFDGDPTISIEKGMSLSRENGVFKAWNASNSRSDFLAEGVVLKIRMKL